MSDVRLVEVPTTTRPPEQLVQDGQITELLHYVTGVAVQNAPSCVRFGVNRPEPSPKVAVPILLDRRQSAPLTLIVLRRGWVRPLLAAANLVYAGRDPYGTTAMMFLRHCGADYPTLLRTSNDNRLGFWLTLDVAARHVDCAHASLDAQRVPVGLHHLVADAEFWGVSDDGYRDERVVRAPDESLRDLVGRVRPVNDQFDDWLAGPEASGPFSREYIAYSALRMAADFATVLVREKHQ